MEVVLTSDKFPLSDPICPWAAVPGPAYGSGHRDLSATVREYLSASVSANTRRAYRADLEHFTAWGGTIPATEVMVAEYLAAHTGKLSVATLTRRLAALSKAHKARGVPSPTSSPLVHATLRGIRRVHGRPPRQAAPLLTEHVIAMVEGLGESLKGLRDRALILIGFAGAFRRSELVALDCNDIEYQPAGIVITLRRSKTDQEGLGRGIAIPYARGEVCPVKALDVWMRAAQISEGPIFRAMDRHGEISDKRLSPEAINAIVKKRAAATGLDPGRYSGHSLRAGLVTSAAFIGVPSWKIREQTGHTSDSMLRRYVRHTDLLSDNAVRSLL